MSLIDYVGKSRHFELSPWSGFTAPRSYKAGGSPNCDTCQRDVRAGIHRKPADATQIV
jgi:hypothetical protein